MIPQSNPDGDRRLRVQNVLDDQEPELEHRLVAGALVACEGDHYRIESGAESWDELEASASRAAGTCDCGSPLSLSPSRCHCRSCGREFRARV